MIGVILLAVSWILLRFERKGLGELGFNHPRQRAGELALGFAVAGCFVVVQQLGLSWASGVGWTLNPDLTGGTVLRQARANVNSVLFEELLFRGYLLYQAIRWLGPRKATFLGAAVFGVYHWFSYGVLGAVVPMVYVFVLTGVMGLMFCAAFAATRSVAAPIGLHLGWNGISYMVFSGGPFGAGLFRPADGSEQMQGPGWGQLVFNVGLPMVMAALVCWYLRRRFGSPRPIPDTKSATVPSAIEDQG